MVLLALLATTTVAGGLIGGAVGGPAGAALGAKAGQAILVTGAAGAAFGFRAPSAARADLDAHVLSADADVRGA